MPINLDIAVGASGTASLMVTEEHTAARVGSGKIAVLATPVMINVIEAAALMACEPHLPPGHQSLGTHLNISHIAATPVGMAITARAVVTRVDGRKVLFDIEVHGEETLRRLLAGGKGLFLIGAHLGSFEVIRAVGRKVADLRVAMVMHEGNAQKVNAMLAAINPQAVQDIIGLGHIDSMLKVWERLDEGCAVGMLADRTSGNDTLYPVQILGTNANLPRGPFRMAAVLRRPVVFMTGLYLGGNRYAIHFDPLADFSGAARAGRAGRAERAAAVEAAITRYAALLDQYCRKAPYNWFNFFDFWQSAPAAMPSKSS